MSGGAREVQRLIRDLERDGWIVEPRKKGYLVRDAAGKVAAHFAMTPSDQRWIKNVMAQLRRHAETGLKPGQK